MANDKRLYDIFEAASRLFILKGYNETQIVDIAKAASISTGALYNLFTSKKAIFHFTLKCIFDQEYLSQDITTPVNEMEPSVLESLTKNVVKNYLQFNLADIEPAQLPPFEEMLAKSYDLLSKFGPGFLIFERNQDVWPKLSSDYFRGRLRYFENLNRCIKAYIQKGEIRQLEHPEYHTRLIIETLALWSIHRKYSPEGINTSDSIAKDVVLDALVHAYATKI